MQSLVVYPCNFCHEQHHRRTISFREPDESELTLPACERVILDDQYSIVPMIVRYNAALISMKELRRSFDTCVKPFHHVSHFYDEC